MSIDIMNRIWWRQDLPTMEKFIALALADAASDDGVCWPAVATIAEKCSCSRRTVQNAVNGLCGKGLLRRQERKDRSSYYIFAIDNLPHVERSRRLKELSPAHAEATGASPAPDLFCTGASGSMTGESRSSTGAGDAPRTVNEPSEESSPLSGDFKSPKPMLADYVASKWKELKAAHPGIADVRKVNDGLRHTIELRAQQHARTGEDGFAVWDEVLHNVATSEFLTGRKPPGPGRDTPFKLSLPWLCTAHHFREVIGGRYNGDRDPNSFDASTGRRLGPTDQAVRSSISRLRATREQRPGRGSARGDQRLAAE